VPVPRPLRQLLKRRRHEAPGAFRDVSKEIDTNDTQILPAPALPAPPEAEGMSAVDPAWQMSKPAGRRTRPAA
jgi:hypothetical protein